MRFLHISDTHFGIEKGDTRKGVITNGAIRSNYMRTLTEQIKEVYQNGEIDFIVFSGDVAWVSAENEYADATSWLTEILSETNLTSDKLYICPGNHDIDREIVEELAFPASQEQANRFLRVEKLNNHLENRFANYIQFCEKLGVPQYSIGGFENYLVGISENDNFRIICVNTAWYAQGDEVKDKMWVGSNFVEVIKNDLNALERKPTIIMMHHPKTSWNEEERSNYHGNKNVFTELCKMGDLVLCGHTHETHVDNEIVECALVTGSGAAYQGGHYQHNFYVYDIDFLNPANDQYRTAYQYLEGKWYTTKEELDTPWKKKCPKIVSGKTISGVTDGIGRVEKISRYYLDPVVKNVAQKAGKKQILEELIAQIVCTSSEEPLDWSQLVNQILDDDEEKVGLAIYGNTGTGKSTFLSLLYERLVDAYRSGRTNRLPVFIDLHKLDSKPLDDAERILEENLNVLEGLLRGNQLFYFIFDGCDDYLRIHGKLEKRINKFINANDEKVILCIGNMDVPSLENCRHHRTPLRMLARTAKIQLHTKNYVCKAPEIESIIRKIIDVLDKKNLDSKVENILGILKRMEYSETDFRTIYTLIQMADKFPKILNSTNPSVVINEYFLNEFENEEQLRKEAKAAMLYMIKQDSDLNDILEEAVGLYKNQVGRDYLIAYFFLDTISNVQFDEETTLRKAGRRGQDEKKILVDENMKLLLSMEYLFTPEINRMLKNILDTKTSKMQLEIIAKCKSIYGHKDASEGLKVQLVYLLGRMTQKQAVKNASQFLLEEYERLNHQLFDDENSASHGTESELLLYRSVAVSLIFLGNSKFEECYLEKLLRNEELNSINRGFNCAYYHDKTYSFGETPIYKDELDKPIDNTLELLILRIAERMKSTDDKQRRPLYMEIITVFSLFEHRMGNKTIYEKYRERMLELADKIIKSQEILSTIVLRYVSMMREIINEERPYQYIFEELYNTKFERRVGWINRNIETPESVTDHMYGCYILGKFLLPETKEELQDYGLSDLQAYADYNKQEIINTVLIHDMGENYIGDKYRKSEDEIKKEDERFDYYSLLSTIPNIYGLGDDIRLWRALFAKSTINAKIANDLDKIEPLLQAHMYKKRGQKIDIDEWIEDVKQSVCTDFGRMILDFIIKNVIDTIYYETKTTG